MSGKLSGVPTSILLTSPSIPTTTSPSTGLSPPPSIAVPPTLTNLPIPPTPAVPQPPTLVPPTTSPSPAVPQTTPTVPPSPPAVPPPPQAVPPPPVPPPPPAVPPSPPHPSLPKPPSSFGSDAPSSSKISPASLRGLKNEREEKTPEAMISEALNRYKKFSQEHACASFQVFNQPTKPMLQDGPQCGLVALRMAVAIFKKNFQLSTQEIFEKAKEKGYTKQGEMFCAQNLKDLTETLLGEDCRVSLENIQVLKNKSQLAADFIKNKVVFLVPYDCDFNHGPCLAGGRKAHWALLTGFILVTGGNNSDMAWESIDPSSTSLKTDNFANNEMLLFGRQSKSLVLGVWDREELEASNENLKNADIARNCEDYVIPSGGGLEESLAGKIIRISSSNYPLGGAVFY